MKKTVAYGSFNENENNFIAQGASITNFKGLPAGSYTLTVNQMGQLVYTKFDIHADKLLDLPTKEYKQVVDQIEKFLQPETKEKFDKYGYLYKRSALLHGAWGTGKTCIVSRVAQYVLNKKDGVILFNPRPDYLILALAQLKDVQPETPVLVIFEELDRLMAQHEGTLLSILDGEVQKDNIIYLATTNFIREIPARVLRPGRFSNVVEVGFPDASCRKFYLEHKLGAEDPVITTWVDKTDGLSIDELKETVLSVKCLDQELDVVIDRIKQVKGMNKSPSYNEDDDFDSDDEDEGPAREILSILKENFSVGRN